MNDKIIEITPELERRVSQDRRQEPRERLAKAEQRLARIAHICQSVAKDPSLTVTALRLIKRLTNQ